VNPGTPEKAAKPESGAWSDRPAFRSSERTTVSGLTGLAFAALMIRPMSIMKPMTTNRIMATKAPAIDRKKVFMTGAIPLLVLKSGISR
jgi:hypothetical protein